MDDPILQGLNPTQQAAVTSPSSVVQVLAPPGSGKTKTLTSRVSYLLSHRAYQPWDIICLTFTIKSAKEMKDRIAALIGNGIESKIILGTFHSVCRRYLVRYGHLIGLRKGFGIADSADSLSIINRIIKRHGFNINHNVARGRISSSKAKRIGANDLRQETKQSVDRQEFIQLFEAYEAQLATSNLLDYDDLLLHCADLLRQHPECVSNVEAVLIDEFQDTNIVQFDLMKLFAAKNNRITTVGDPDQSIYGWRSAEVKNLKRMRKLFPETHVVHLEENYRSSGAILRAALEVIQQDESRPQKALSPTHCHGTLPVLRKLPSSAAEAQWIVSEIKRCILLTGETLMRFSDFAILLRSASLSRQIESEMGKSGIPYRMVGGSKFFDRVEVKVLLDYLRVVGQPENSPALSRIINKPKRGIGDSTIKSLLEESSSRHTTLWNLVREAVQGHVKLDTKLSKAQEQSLGSIINIILIARKKMVDPDNPHPPQKLLEYLLKKLEFKAWLEKKWPDDHENRWANVEELVAQAHDTLTPESPEEDVEALPSINGVTQEFFNINEQALSAFLANVALSTEIHEEDETDDNGPQEKVTISTIHAAKGLEWPVIFIPSAYKGSIPHSRAEDSDEERRLLYVAMTRAQALLYLSCPTKNSTWDATELSPFLSTKKVQNHLINKGPSYTLDIVLDIARILNRAPPTKECIQLAKIGAERIEDDRWSLDGSDNPEVFNSKWDADNSDDVDQPPKRRKLDITAAGYRDKVTPSSIYSSYTTFNAATNLQNSNPPVIDFIPASAQYATFKDEEEERSKTRSLSSKPESKSSRQNLDGTNKRKTSKAAKGQGTLTSLWKNSTKATGATTAQTSLRKDTTPLENEILVDNMDPSLPTLPTFAPSSSRPSTVGSRNPMSTIPDSLSNRSIKRGRNPTRSKVISEENDGDHTYAFLSSPPPKASSGKVAEPDADDCTQNHSIPEATTQFPNTTMAKLQARSGLSNKTLGVRRSMAGWSAGGNKSFQPPKSTRPPA